MSFKFYHRKQEEEESVKAFIVEIRKIARNCNFSFMLDRMRQDRIVRDVRSKTVAREKRLDS